MPPKNSRLHWTDEEKKVLNEMMFIYPISEIADLLGRSETACTNMYKYGTEHRRETEAERLRWEERDPAKTSQ